MVISRQSGGVRKKGSKRKNNRKQTKSKRKTNSLRRKRYIYKSKKGPPITRVEFNNMDINAYGIGKRRRGSY